MPAQSVLKKQRGVACGLAAAWLLASTTLPAGTASATGAAASTTSTPATTTSTPASTTSTPASTTSVPAATTVPVSATTEATTTTPGWGTTSTSVPGTLSAPGYWVVTNAGSVASFGGVAYRGSLSVAVRQPVVGIAPARDGGYWLADQDGTVYPLGGAPVLGSLGAGALGPSERVVAIAATADGLGYWLVTSQGAVYSFGDAGYYGSPANISLRSPVVAFAPVRDGRGYWLAARDGGVFAYGDAHFYGSEASAHIAWPIVGLAATPDGKGYWLAAASGQVYAFGDAEALSPTGGKIPSTTSSTTPTSTTSSTTGRAVGAAKEPLAPVVAIVASPAPPTSVGPLPQGYWLLRSNGSVEAFGAAPYRGDGQGTLPYLQDAVAMVAGAGKGTGMTSAGAFGPSSPSKLVAPTTTSTLPTTSTTTSTTNTTPTTTTATTTATTTTVPKPNQGPKPKPAGANTSTTRSRRPKAKPAPKAVSTYTGPEAYPPGARGYDVSWPQCGGPLPPKARVAVVGVNGGWAFTENPCFASEARWAGHNLSTYINLNSPRGSDPAQWANGPGGHCARGNFYCMSYNYGYNTARFSVTKALDSGARSKTWWLDVELGPNWSSSQRDNAAVVAGAIAALRSVGLRAAVYSTTYQWDIITGGFVPGTSAWYPTGIATPHPVRWCWPRSFAGGPISLVQSAAGRYDGDYAC
jgi:hypothetical protein